MTTLYSTALENHLAVTGSLKAALDDCLIGIFSGPPPASADDAIDGSSVLLVTISVGGAGTGCTWNGTAANGVLSKTAAEAWKGTVANTGVATFFRIYVPSDNGQGADSSVQYMRVQGAVGIDATADMIIPSTSLTSGNEQDIGTGQLL